MNVGKRIDEWNKQCGSQVQVLRAFFPDTEKGAGGGVPSVMKGRVRPGEPNPWCHRVERLIHLELGDLVTTEAYLDPEWPMGTSMKEDSATTQKKMLRKVKCDDCA